MLMKAGIPMHHRILRHLRVNVVAYLALGVAVAGGSGYALAATSTSKTITACANKKTGAIFYARHGRCGRRQIKLRWNQRGLRGRTGATGPQGAPGAPAAQAWAIVGDDGSILFGQGQGLSAQHTGTGLYAITVTAAACAGKDASPIVTPSDGGVPAGAFATAWVGNGLTGPFTVHTGVVSGGSFAPTDMTFNVQVNG
jgi:hypothetical protein